MKILIHPRGTTEVSDQYIGPPSQITVDTERWELRLHDGITPGGHRILNLEQLLLIFMSKDSEFGEVEFDEDDKGHLTRIGDRQWVLRKMSDGIAEDDDVTVPSILIGNPLGTDGDPTFSVNGAWLSQFFVNLAAQRLVYLGYTGGTEDILTITTTDPYPLDYGSAFLFTFHTDPVDGAYLNINDSGAVPLHLYSKSTNLAPTLKAIDTVLVVRLDDAYSIVGVQPAGSVGINVIGDLVSLNVQGALEELYARLVILEGAGGDPVDYGAWLNFGDEINRIDYAPFPYMTILPASGDSCVVTKATADSLAGSGGGGNEGSGNTTRSENLYCINLGGVWWVGGIQSSGFVQNSGQVSTTMLIAPPQTLRPAEQAFPQTGRAATQSIYTYTNKKP